MGEVEVENGNGEAEAKTRVESASDPHLDEKIVAQLEYYFSDVNLSRDKFMQQQMKLDEGWIPLDLLLKFKRLAAIVGDREKSVIVQAVRKSSLLEVSPEQDKMRRSSEHPLPDGYDELRKALMMRTVYCKGFPLQDITFDEMFEFFKTFGKIESVIMRHYLDRATKNRGFKGSAFVTFPTVEKAQAFLDLDEVKYKDNILLRKWQSQYVDDKRKERLDDKIKHQQRRRDNKRPNKKKDAEGVKKGGETEEEEKGGAGFPLGAVIHFTGVSQDSKLHRDTIREAVESRGLPVAFIDFNPGDLSGYVRMDLTGAASKLVDKLKEESDGKLKAGDEELEIRVLEGEEETNFLDRARKEMNKKRHFGNKRKHRSGRGGGNFGDRGRKREGGPVEGAPSPKVPATAIPTPTATD